MHLTGEALPASAVVIAAGRASTDLARQLGFNAPLVAERGYHVMLAPDNVRFDLPVSPAGRGFFVTPMEEGLRVAGTVELAAPHQPPSWHRADLLVRHLQGHLLPGVGGAERSQLDRRGGPACPISGPPSAARRGSPTSIAAMATSMSA